MEIGVKMRKLGYCVTLLFGLWIFGFVCNSESAFAFSVTASVSENGGYCRSYNSAGRCPDSWVSQFDVSITSGCSDCSAAGKFECVDGTEYATPNSTMRGEASFSYSSGGYDYYDVTLSDGQSMHQQISGQIKKPAKVNFQARSINMNGNEVGNNPFHNENVDRGSSPSANAPAWVGDYRFRGWKGTSSGSSTCSTSLSNGSWYTVNGIYSDTTIYAVYAKDKTLTAKSIDTAGNSLAGVSGLGDQSTSVVHCNSASVTRGTATGYTFLGFRRNASSGGYTTSTNTSSAEYVSGSSSPKETFNVKSITEDITEHAVYVRNEFAGKMTASGGIDTGWVETNQSKTGEIDCDNYDTGCTATFQPALKTVKGTGSTVYSVQRSKNGGSWSSAITLNPASPFAPATSGTNINKASGNYSEKLYPGESVCYKITFRPYGTKGDTDTVSLSACVTAKTSTFKGKVTATGVTDGPKNTGLVNSNTTKRYYVRNCSPTAGCTVSFNHSMERANSIGASDWVVSRTSNLTNNSAKVSGNPNSIAIPNNASVATGTFRPSTNTSRNGVDTTVQTGSNLKLYPGMVVCEKITFAKNNTYNSSNPGTYAQAYAQACVMALGPSQPGDPGNPDNPEDPGRDEKSSTDSSFLNIKVRNVDVTKYNKYQHMVYAKPGDNVRFRATYNPNLQYTYYLKAERVKINSGTANPTSGRSTYQLGAYFNTLNGCNVNNRNVVNCWNSGFGLSSNFSSASKYNYAKLYTVGNTDKQIEPLDAYTVVDGDVGSEKGETAKTNSTTKVNKDGNALLSSNTNKDDRTTAKQVTFDCDAKVSGACSDGSGNNNVGTVDTNPQTKAAYFRIPYNFTTGAEVTTNEDTPVFAGEATSISFRIDVNPKHNDETMDSDDEDYTTTAKDVRRELVVYKPNSYTNARKNGGIMSGAREADVCSTYFGYANDEVNCGYAGNETGTLSNSAGRNATTTHNFSKTFYAQDMPAGSEICVAVAVFPATSGADTNYNDMQYSRSWTISSSKCYKIAKKPSLQVWGGNIYTSVGAETATARKNNLAGYTDGSYKVGSKLSTDYIFGSWGELGLVSSGRVKELSSGATLGYVGNNGDSTNVLNLWPSHHPASPNGNNAVINGRAPGGTTSTNNNGTLCARSPLTFANSPCGSTVGQLGNSVSKRSSEDDKASVIEKYVYDGGDTTVSEVVNLADETGKMRDDSVYYYYSGDNNLTLPGGSVEIGKTKVVHSNKTVAITNNVIYEDGYENFSDMPKLIVYAKGDIKIGCNVERIDGILIAEGTVTTCVDESGNAPEVNSSLRSNQLVINGTIVAKKLVPNRTYGAGTGANSIVPAEVINFDPTLYQWGGQKMESQGVDTNLDVTYSREIAPRL